VPSLLCFFASSFAGLEIFASSFTGLEILLMCHCHGSWLGFRGRRWLPVAGLPNVVRVCALATSADCHESWIGYDCACRPAFSETFFKNSAHCWFAAKLLHDARC
jgi:hypothetical protein